MRNYGFDYLVEKMDIITEMGRPSNVRPELDERVIKFQKDIIPQISKKLFEGWKPSAKAKILTDFIATLLYENAEGATYTYPSVYKYGASLKKQDPKYLKDYKDFIRGGSDDSNKTGRWGFSILMNKDPEYLLSDELLQKALDPEYIEEWKPRFIKDIENTSNRGKGFSNKIQQQYGQSVGDFTEMRGKVWPIIVKINRRAKKFMPPNIIRDLRSKENVVKEYEAGVDDTEMYDINMFQGTLESIADDPNLMSYYKLSPKDIKGVINLLQKKIDNRTPLSKEDIISKIIPVFPNEELQSYILDEYEQDLVGGKVETSNEDRVDRQRAAISNILDIYTPDFLNRIKEADIITEEEMGTVLNWKGLVGGVSDSDDVDEHGLTKDEWEDSAKTIRKYESDQYAKKKNGNKKNAEKTAPVEVGSDAAERIVEIQTEIQDILLSDDPDMDRIEELEDELSTLQGEENEERGVMGYMSEQVNKDRHTHQKGEFKERGFKRAKNYNHWMMLND